METLLDFGCEAAILLGPESRTPVLAGRLPVVVLGWHVDDPAVELVRTSDDEGMREAVEHLVGLGHRRIVHIDGGSGPVSVARRSGYLDAMHGHGLGGQSRVIDGGFTQEHGVAAAGILLAGRQLPTAVIAYNDDVATGLLDSLLRAGLTVPDDLSIVGWDDSYLSRLPHLDLTTVHQDTDALARLAVRQCAARLSDRHQEIEREVILPPHLVVRGSTRPTARP